MSARLDQEVMKHLVQMHRELLLRENTAEDGVAACSFMAGEPDQDFAAEEIFQPRRLSLRVF